MIPARCGMSALAARSLRTSLPRTCTAVPRLTLSVKPTFAALPPRSRSFHVTPLRLEAEVVKVPSMAESITEGTLKQWLKQEGDYVEVDEEVATIETDKIDVAVNAPKSGYIRGLLAAEEDTVTVGQDLFKLEPGEQEGGAKKEEPKESEPKEEKAKVEPKKEKEKEKKTEESTKESESAEEVTKENKTSAESDKKQPEPSAKAKEEHPAPKSEPKKPAPASKKEEPKKSSPAPAAGSRNETRVKMSRMRLRIAERLKQSQNSAAALTTFNEIDMSALMSMRAKYKDEILKTKGVKLGFMSAFARASCIALKEIPAANASIEGDQIIYRDYVDLSVAVATEKGLVTPVLRNAEGLNFVEIEQGIVDLGKKARDGKLSLEDMAGGSFTISNGGVFGSLYGTPIINVPQAAVLGMHSIVDRPVVVDGKIVIRPIMVVALTYDHRLLDGREAVTFLVTIKKLIEDPAKMLLLA